jgi:hypothetical protein
VCHSDTAIGFKYKQQVSKQGKSAESGALHQNSVLVLKKHVGVYENNNTGNKFRKGALLKDANG